MRTLTHGINKGFLYMDALIGLIILSLTVGALAGMYITAAVRVGTMQDRVELILQESLVDTR